MNRIAILGKGIGYTLSPEIHAAIAKATNADIVCDTVDIAEGDFKSAVERLFGSHVGFFVTKPYKSAVLPFVSGDGSNAVNVVRSSDKKAINTDGTGFMLALDRNFEGWKNDVSSALVLGAGGAAWAAVTSLMAARKTVYVLARSSLSAAKLCSATGAKLYANQNVELCVNCTSAGDSDDVFNSLCLSPQFKYAYEMYYAAQSTPFTARAAKSGSKTAIGIDMLIYQAIVGDSFLLGEKFDIQTTFDKVKNILERK